jgi:phage terminase large subunit-like protein
MADFRNHALRAGHQRPGPCDCAHCRAILGLSLEDVQRFWLAGQYEWETWARPEQLAPVGAWNVWVLLCGRGAGKTRPAAELVRKWSRQVPLIALMAKDDAMVRDVMIEGDSGILACSPPWWRPEYDKSKLRLTWPNGAKGIKMSAEAGADAARGRQFYKAWAEEIAAWPNVEEAWHEGLMNAVRLGTDPQAVVTTTPQPTSFVADLCLGKARADGTRPVERERMRESKGRSKAAIDAWYEWEHGTKLKDGRLLRTVVRRWSTERNSANLAPGFAETRRAQYGESKFARQELDAEILERIGTELWTEKRLLEVRVPGVPVTMVRVAVGVDPTRADSPTDEAGIVVAGLGEDGIAYVLADQSLKASPQGWRARAVEAYHTFQAAVMVYEQNRMGQTAEQEMRLLDPKIKWKAVTATKGKLIRAEPIAALYEQDKVRHVVARDAEGRGSLRHLELEMTTWDPRGRVSPNRMDALVIVLTELMLSDERRVPLIVR